jgi:UDP-N-acetyl-D-glucosamine/UDP-N-acetyl-D-galactosamine dehydrogenase
LKEFGVELDVYDPWANKHEVYEEYGVNLIENLEAKYDGILLAVSHDEYKALNLENFKNSNAVIFDIKGVLEKDSVDARL